MTKINPREIEQCFHLSNNERCPNKIQWQLQKFNEDQFIIIFVCNKHLKRFLRKDNYLVYHIDNSPFNEIEYEIDDSLLIENDANNFQLVHEELSSHDDVDSLEKDIQISEPEYFSIIQAISDYYIDSYFGEPVQEYFADMMQNILDQLIIYEEGVLERNVYHDEYVDIPQ
jgi:hypothetical protein